MSTGTDCDRDGCGGTLNERVSARLRAWADAIEDKERAELLRMAADGLMAELWWHRRTADDAARLDWLDAHPDTGISVGLDGTVIYRVEGGVMRVRRGGTIRAALDAARVDGGQSDG